MLGNSPMEGSNDDTKLLLNDEKEVKKQRGFLKRYKLR